MKVKEFDWVRCAVNCLNQDLQASSIFAGLDILLDSKLPFIELPKYF